MGYIFTVGYHLAIERLPFTSIQRDLVIIISSEVSQAQNDKHHKISYAMLFPKRLGTDCCLGTVGETGMGETLINSYCTMEWL